MSAAAPASRRHGEQRRRPPERTLVHADASALAMRSRHSSGFTHASALIAAGLDIATISRRFGHGDRCCDGRG
jgi:hypothetical protein